MKLTRVSDLRSLKLTVTAQMGAVQRQARASRSQDGQHLETSFPSLRRPQWLRSPVSMPSSQQKSSLESNS